MKGTNHPLLKTERAKFVYNKKDVSFETSRVDYDFGDAYFYEF